MKYILEWLKTFNLGFYIGKTGNFIEYFSISIQLIFINIYLKYFYKLEEKDRSWIDWGIEIKFIKWCIALTNSKRFDKDYDNVTLICKKIKNIRFLILKIIGNSFDCKVETKG